MTKDKQYLVKVNLPTWVYRNKIQYKFNCVLNNYCRIRTKRVFLFLFVLFTNNKYGIFVMMSKEMTGKGSRHASKTS